MSTVIIILVALVLLGLTKPNPPRRGNGETDPDKM